MKAVLRFYMPHRLLAHFSESTDVWVCNYTLNAVFLKEVCVAAQTLNRLKMGTLHQALPAQTPLRTTMQLDRLAAFISGSQLLVYTASS